MTVSIAITITKDGQGPVTHLVTPSDTALDKVLFDFNVTADPRVAILKALSAGQIEMMLRHQDEQKRADPFETFHVARSRAAAVAITQAELTQMALVKSLFAKA